MINKNILDIGKKCTGCSACACSCPVNAISMKVNPEGFLYPFIDTKKCVSCQKCFMVCPSNGLETVKSTPLKAVGLKNKNRDELLHSASGGAAYIIAKNIILSGGIVFGAIYDENLVVRHQMISNLQELPKIQSSKYVQSDMGSTFKAAKQFLDEGRVVLFTGTPCQIAGLKSFLRIEYENLYTIDIICHGVPSPKLFKYHLDSISRKQQSNVMKWDFRYKVKKGWGTNYYYECENGKTDTNPLEFFKYGIDFLNGSNYRESCYLCNYSYATNRPADLTVGDFWRLMKINPRFYSDDGVSSVIVNSEKGLKLIDSVEKEIAYFVCDYQDIVLGQDNLKGPTQRPEERENYYIDMNASFFETNIHQIPVKARLLNLLPQQLTVYLKRIKALFR
ncbi:4Fe-4S dicluster domain-containing protein [Lactonifactor sp. BIOML-A3]|uniref:Coenzyme F420 hydrogenase/dehydrogenase, beta subunit C-terminal domain n=1 Tax=unclassified Lactonifactor TaxID=2636670 RepID=UPI0012B0B95F|nr:MULTISPECIES: Coenzyme F420 hydrogenase/dehydrogenase, beta subunit C-terminal domain [unclassified Lactonifactor]MSA01738.1 4Fe-4S dicluster domain-containing protein [Lactonifactor sp. BIOML-A5]MSA08736.1 4Fe-4S dicluster domain-containing protein [Lactonifactor sp. BIOML-A4]MSA13868.1 4Fe-4S dicluster domain-containing protein [Lactonifactor sp. BIOML-A3]MSA17109.1 4Fe-4S dicluster domain-containing protein [Lactonifactor sp. BIOML-A2]MSA37788.1 4Fe-4S dicluster domain-containing protein